jgi:hypothetical protein
VGLRGQISRESPIVGRHSRASGAFSPDSLRFRGNDNIFLLLRRRPAKNATADRQEPIGGRAETSAISGRFELGFLYHREKQSLGK